MPPLICSTACDRSPPARIARWIAQLEELRERYPDDTSFQESVIILLERARGWLPRTEPTLEARD